MASSGRSASSTPQQLLHTITAALAQRYGVAYRYLWLNPYRTHRDSTSWHGPRISVNFAPARP